MKKVPFLLCSCKQKHNPLPPHPPGLPNGLNGPILGVPRPLAVPWYSRDPKHAWNRLLGASLPLFPTPGPSGIAGRQPPVRPHPGRRSYPVGKSAIALLETLLKTLGSRRSRGFPVLSAVTISDVPHALPAHEPRLNGETVAGLVAMTRLKPRTWGLSYSLR